MGEEGNGIFFISFYCWILNMVVDLYLYCGEIFYKFEVESKFCVLLGFEKFVKVKGVKLL